MRKIKLIFAWYDLWIGIFYDKKKEWIYIFPVPCFGIIIKLLPDGYSVVKYAILHEVGKNTHTPYVKHLYRIFKGDVLIGTFADDHTKKKLRQICWKNHKFNNSK